MAVSQVVIPACITFVQKSKVVVFALLAKFLQAIMYANDLVTKIRCWL